MDEMNYMKDMCTIVIYLFNPSQKGAHYHPANKSNSDTYDNGDDIVIVVIDKDNNSNNSTYMILTSMVNIFRSYMIYIQVTKGCGKENDDKNK